MRWILLLALSACATRDVLHSERLVARAVCNQGIAIYGYPGDYPLCPAQVTAIGDGCYVARLADDVPDRRLHLLQCDAAAPDGHVMCFEDNGLPSDKEIFGEDGVRTGWRVWSREFPDGRDVTADRCRDRFRRFELAYMPPRPAPELVAFGWRHTRSHGEVELPRMAFFPIEDTESLRRIIGHRPNIEAVVCPGAPPKVEIENRFPSRFEQQLGLLVGQAFTIGGRMPVDRCTRVSFQLAIPAR